jgi:hypothetical protein
MKTYWDYTDKERSEMTEEQVHGFLGCELMSKGVLKPEPLKLDPVDEVKLDTTVYYRLKRDWRVVGDIVFSRYEDALAVARMTVLHAESDYQTGREFASQVNDLSVAEVALPNESLKSEAKSALEQEKLRKDRNKKAQEAFDKATAEVTKATADIWNDWYASKSMARDYQRVIDTMAEYTALTGGDMHMAATFLAKSFTEDRITDAFEWFGMIDPRKVLDQSEPAPAEAKTGEE